MIKPTHIWPSVNRMIKSIESKIAIRGIWRCRAGWGMQLVTEPGAEPPVSPIRPPDAKAIMAQLQRERQWRESHPDKVETFAYYDSIEACVRAEWITHVFRPGQRPSRSWKYLKGDTFK